MTSFRQPVKGASDNNFLNSLRALDDGFALDEVVQLVQKKLFAAFVFANDFHAAFDMLQSYGLAVFRLEVIFRQKNRIKRHARQINFHSTRRVAFVGAVGRYGFEIFRVDIFVELNLAVNLHHHVEFIERRVEDVAP